MSLRNDSVIISEEDLLQIESILYEPKTRELTARQFLNVNTNFTMGVKEIGYDSYTRKGSAKVYAKGANAKDVTFVGEDVNRTVHKVYDIITGIEFTRDELESVSARNILGKGPALKLDTLRIETARRLVAETENRLVMVGDADYGIKGLLNFVGIQSVAIAQGAFVGTAAQKRQWINKTPKEILADLRIAKTAAKQSGLFNPDTLLVSPNEYEVLTQPYSDQSPMTILQWLQTQGASFSRIIQARELSFEYNLLGGVNCFVVMETSREVAEIAVVRDLQVLPPVYDFLQNSQQAVIESTAGIMLRHPSAVYVGLGN